MSIASVAMANGLNANLLRNWLVRKQSTVFACRRAAARRLHRKNLSRCRWWPVLRPRRPVSRDPDRAAPRNRDRDRDWPAQAASECAAWLRDWLR